MALECPQSLLCPEVGFRERAGSRGLWPSRWITPPLAEETTAGWTDLERGHWWSTLGGFILVLGPVLSLLPLLLGGPELTASSAMPICKGPWRAKRKMNKVEEVTLLDSKIYYKATVIKIVCDTSRINMLTNGVELSPEINPDICGQQGSQETTISTDGAVTTGLPWPIK